MKVAVVADLHLHNFKMFARTLPDGRNSRLKACLDAFDQVLRYCHRHDIRHLWFLGDYFNSRTSIEIPVYIDGWNALRRFHELGMNILMIIGNHDQYLKDSDLHSLCPFEEIAYIVSQPQVMNLSGQKIVCVPYTESESVAKWVRKQAKESSICLGHVAVSGALSGIGGHRLRGRFTPEDFSGFGQTLLGHFHYRQRIGNIQYVGSLLQHNFGERGQKKGFFVWEDGKLEFVTVRSPEFIELDEVNERVAGNYVRLKKRSDTEKALQLGAKGVIVRSTSQVSTLKTTQGMNATELIKRFVTESETDLDKRKLISLGLEIYKEGQSAIA
ncbi:MAG: metallophosphoesterase [Methanosarcinales archaeon]